MKLEPMNALELIARPSPTQKSTPDLPPASVPAAGRQGTPELFGIYMSYLCTHGMDSERSVWGKGSQSVPITKYKIIPHPNPNPNTKMTVNTIPKQM